MGSAERTASKRYWRTAARIALSTAVYPVDREIVALLTYPEASTTISTVARSGNSSADALMVGSGERSFLLVPGASHSMGTPLPGVEPVGAAARALPLPVVVGVPPL